MVSGFYGIEFVGSRIRHKATDLIWRHGPEPLAAMLSAVSADMQLALARDNHEIQR